MFHCFSKEVAHERPAYDAHEWLFRGCNRYILDADRWACIGCSCLGAWKGECLESSEDEEVTGSVQKISYKV
jgi:hypothetical protein